MADVSSVFSFASKALLAIVIVDLLIAALIGLLFSSILTKPINTMIERISQLRQRNFFIAPHPKRPGIYKPVFSNLNAVAETLMKHEEERLKLEKMRNEWISNVSHDLKTPLASIRGYAELLRDREVPDKERLEYAGVIERQSIYMKDLLDDFNLTMKLRNQHPLQLQETRIEAFVRELIIDLLNDPQFKDRDISFNSAAPELKLSIDQHLMKRALLNFVYNALIHNEDHTAVTVTIDQDFISIVDNGKGIPEEELGQVFDRYYRGTNTTNSRGTGLGMAIARDIIEAHGMTVELTSEAGKGTVVQIWFKGLPGSKA